MKAIKHGNRYQITYRCPHFSKPISEYFDSIEEANLRIAQIQLEKKRGTLLPSSHLVDPDRDHALVRENHDDPTAHARVCDVVRPESLV